MFNADALLPMEAGLFLMDNSKDVESKISFAEKLISEGQLRKARAILAHLAEQFNADALFLYSTFSISKEETVAEFERRSIEMLEKAAELGHAKAAYALGVCYEFGDGVICDKSRAASLFKKSAEGGYPKAKLSYGLDLIYGSNGIPQNRDLGVALLKEAAKAGVSEALDELAALGESI